MEVGYIKDLLRPLYDKFRYYRVKYHYRNRIPEVLNSVDTLKLIAERGLSVSRYGDGELFIMNGQGIRFCEFDKTLSNRLKEVAVSSNDRHIVCIPPMINTLKGLTRRPKHYWMSVLGLQYPSWCRYFSKSVYGSAFISRFYMDFQNPKEASEVIELWKSIWNDRDVLIIEGDGTRMGMGNDLFDNAHSVSRILCPSTHAYRKYDEILECAKAYVNNHLILIALGPVATVLAYDLFKLGCQAIDLGHLDIEYEWFKMKADHKVNIRNKAVNEIKDGGENVTDDISEAYKSQIICKISL